MNNLVYRDLKKRKLYAEYELLRLHYKSLINDLKIPREIRSQLIFELNNLPKNSSKSRIKNRCVLTGRNHSIFRFCRLSRIKFRDLASTGDLMGVKKSSW